MDKLHTAWQDLLAELSHRAPATRGALRPPDPSALGVEARLPRVLNEELRSWFGLHGGFHPWTAGQIFPFNAAIDLPAAVDDTLLRRGIWQAVPPGERAVEQPAGTVEGTWLDAYVALTRDGMGGGLFVDLRPGALHGCVRWWDKVDADDFEVLAPSVAALVAEVTRSLRTGASVGGWEPFVADGVVDWTTA